jgi:hypothetical protein
MWIDFRFVAAWHRTIQKLSRVAGTTAARNLPALRRARCACPFRQSLTRLIIEDNMYFKFPQL